MMELTPEEMKFFETGDIADLGLPAATLEPASVPAPVSAPEPAPAPVPVPASPPAAAEGGAGAGAGAAELQRVLEQEAARRGQLEQSLAKLQKQIEEATKPPPEPEPDVTKDPLGAMMHKLQKIMGEVEALKTQQVQQTQEVAQQTQFRQFVQHLHEVRDAFAKTTPDFPDAYAHLRNARADDLRDVGVPEADIPRALLQDEMAVSHNAIQQGKNPAQVIYNMAKRYGYRPNGAPATPQAAPSVQERIAVLSKGTALDVALPKAGGDADLTLEGLKDAGDADLDRLVQDEKLWSRLVGGERDIF